MTLNGVMALILRYFAEFGVTFGPITKRWLTSHQQILSREMSKYTKHDGRAVLFAVA